MQEFSQKLLFFLELINFLHFLNTSKSFWFFSRKCYHWLLKLFSKKQVELDTQLKLEIILNIITSVKTII